MGNNGGVQVRTNSDEPAPPGILKRTNERRMSKGVNGQPQQLSVRWESDEGSEDRGREAASAIGGNIGLGLEAQSSGSSSGSEARRTELSSSRFSNLRPQQLGSVDEAGSKSGQDASGPVTRPDDSSSSNAPPSSPHV
eukprot:CAMPEP_0168638142 /NCGR_PEP_ID=MMETSP0503-20121227/4931_1 /TAXON_ID=89963 /ORGANISM="Heterocapsa rotundata, Strain SCCAP K-0483" /LENGTH=137 /DNA_ID=CAMNT_0008681357 /DNA_START=54 /DNA_END=464 /DNA_ORIENTATION=+